MVVKTFRGLLADDGQDRIRLQTIKGKVGYRIVKFDIIDGAPGTLNSENVVKMYKTEQSTIDAVVNFTDSDLLGIAFYKPQVLTRIIFFDSEIFNQDIYVTHKDISANNNPCNYYIELEVIPLDDAGAEYTTLKDMRSA